MRGREPHAGLAAKQVREGTVEGMGNRPAARTLVLAMLAAMLAAAALAGLAPARADGQSGAAWVGGTPQPGTLRWELRTSGPTKDIVMLDASGRRVPWAADPQERDGVVELFPPALGPGAYTVRAPDGTVAFTQPGFDFPAALAGVTSGESDPPFGPGVAVAVASAVMAVGLVGALLIGRRRGRRAGVAAAGASVTLAGCALALALLPATSAQPAGASAPGPVPRSAVVGLYDRCKRDLAGFDTTRDCWDSVSARIAAGGGVEALRAALGVVAQSPEGLCHEVAHSMGRTAWFLTHDADAIVAGVHEARCQQGLQHGAMDGASEHLEVPDLARAVDAMCAPSDDGYSGQQADERMVLCVHGVGHALTRRTGGNVQKALDGCRYWTGSVAQACRAAVGMEWHRLWMLAATEAARPPGPADPRAVCSLLGELERKVLSTCYTSAGSVLRAEEPVGLLDWCEANAGAHASTCRDGLSGSFAAYAKDLPEIGRMCERIPQENQDFCVSYNVYELMLRRRDRGDGLCEVLPAGQRPACAEGIEHWLREATAQSDVILEPSA